MNNNFFQALQNNLIKFDFRNRLSNQHYVKALYSTGGKDTDQHFDDSYKKKKTLNVLGEKLKVCSDNPVTGFMRDGFCRMTPYDFGYHVVCIKANQEFLEYSKEGGNDLTTPFDTFPGLNPGDKWCVCAQRFREAVRAGKAPKVDLEATDQIMLKFVKKQDLVSNSEYGVQQTITILQ